jgi:bifunctional DNA-binding transcriptional regulator/antitoxin component of YhaV-PrlF toxin-antitoxin module
MNHIDDIGRVLIPKQLRNPLGWEIGNEMELIPDVNKKSLSVKLANVNSKNRYVIDDLSRIQIPKTILDLLGWKYKNALTQIIMKNDKSITMMIAA